MAEALPNRPPFRNGAAPKLRTAPLPGAGLNGRGGPAEAAAPSGAADALGNDDLLLQEMNQLTEENRGLLAELGSGLRSESPGGDAPGLEQLLAENDELRRNIAELERLVAAATQPEGKSWEEREQDFESLLEEKSELIRALHLKVQALEQNHGQPEAPAQPQAPRVANEEELQAFCDELERERAQLDADRKQLEAEREQLREDEEALMKQMRDMEMSMSKERAELARQRNELQRLHADVQHALELAARDASLRDRLGPLQRRHQDINNRKGAAPQQAEPGAAPAHHGHGPAAGKRNESGIFKRLFGNSGQ